MPTELVLTALEQALTLRQPAPGLIIHADRGSQYNSLVCRKRIEKAQTLASFSHPGNLDDNAQAEAAWFASLDGARLEAAYYLDTYFNLDRRHSALGYRSPHQFERDYLTSLSELTVRLYWTTPKHTSQSKTEQFCRSDVYHL